MTIATSKNLTFLGIGTLLAGIGAALVQFANGGLSAINWEVFIGAIILGVGQIMAKGAASTGGTVDAGGKPVVDPAPPVPVG